MIILPYKFRKKIGPSACIFIEEIIDGMQDWVRVINKDDTIIFVNKSMREALGIDIVGQKCYETIGRTTPCINCVSRKNRPDWSACKEETINGRIFSVTSSPLKSDEIESEDTVIEVLHDITEIKEMSVALENQNERLKEDLLMAKRLQCSLLPKESLVYGKINFSFIYRPCETLGGDFIDIFKLDDDHIGLYIADVSGHGVAASMLTMFLSTALDKTKLSPAMALTLLYADYNKNDFFSELYIAVFYAVIDTKNYTITYCNAGLNVCPIIFSEDSFKILRASGIPISNWVKSPNYTEVTININQKDRLFLYTDGIIEIRNKNHGQFGEERVVEHILESELQPLPTLTKLIEKAISFSDNSSPDSILDDITVALLEIK
ncbi:MAG: PP2C family protein-serine/threonine phosphatase [Ruminiclostridium sp.]